MPTDDELSLVRAPVTMVEDDLARILSEAGLNARQREIVARRLGWDGGGGMTLEAAANGEMTRERVRQLEERVRDASLSTQSLSAVESALNLLVEKAPIASDEAAELLLDAGLARRPFDPVGLVNVARFAGIESSLTVVAGCLYAGDQRKHAARISEAARKLVSRNGAASVGGIVDSLDHGIDIDVVRRALALETDTRWLDGEREWLFLPTGRNRAANHLRKMLAVARSLSVGEVREGFRRYRDREVILPRHIVRELCECFDWVCVDGDRVSSAEPLDFRAVLENTEETLVDIFHEYGPVLDRPTAIDLGEQRGLDRTTTGLYLGWSPIIERITTNRYALRGADVPAGTLEAMHGSSPRRRVQRGYGWTSGGRLWIGYMLSQAVIDSNVVGVPSALRRELGREEDVARYDLAAPNDDLGQIATDGSNIWGLARLLTRYAAEAGDALVLEFDLPTKGVHAFVGGEELLDPENRPDDVVEESAPESGPAAAPVNAPPSGLDELAAPRPALFDPQLDLQSVALDIEPAPATADPAPPEEPGDLSRAREDTVRVARPDASAHTTTLIEALAPGLPRTSKANEQDIVDGLEHPGRIADERRRAALTDEHLTASGHEIPANSESPLEAAADEGAMERCVVPGCDSPGKHKLGVRCRVWHEPSPIAGKSKTSALWAPDSDAFLCDKHALGGAHITLIFEPNDSGETAIKVIAAPYTDDRRTPIRHEPRASSATEKPDEPPEFGAAGPAERPR